METTIQLEKNTVKALKKIKEHPRQSYNELIQNLINFYQNVKVQNQYDEFLHHIQQDRMKELWDNSEDGEWS